MKTAPEVIYYRYAYAEEFKEIHKFARGLANHSLELLRAYAKRIPITAAKKKTSRNKQIHLKYMIALPSCLFKKASDRLSEPAAEDRGKR